MRTIFRKLIKRTKIFSLRTIAVIADFLNITEEFQTTNPHNCLIVSTTGIGDTIWGTPAIRTLKEKIPNLNLSVLTNVNGAEVFRENPFINKSFVFKKGILNILSLLKELRKSRFDTVIVFHATDRIIWLMAYLTGAGKIIGSTRHSKETDFLITHPVDIPHNTLAIHARHMLLEELGINTITNKIEMFITDEERREIDSLFESLALNKDSIVIGFHTGAAKPYKRWPAENFIKLGKLIIDRWSNAFIILTGNRMEKTLSQLIADNIMGISLAGRLSIRETAAVIERCNLFVTNDTGPMHIAVALGIPTIALFSATGIENVEPYLSINTFTAISKPKPCKECISKACTEPVCMEQISPEEVFEIVKGTLESCLNYAKEKIHNTPY